MSVVPFSLELAASDPRLSPGGGAPRRKRPSQEGGIRLTRVRELEAIAERCRTLHARLDSGRWSRTRARLRKQLRRLGTTIDAAQRVVLAGDALAMRASEAVLDLGPGLDQALQGPVSKQSHKALRRACKRARLRLEAALPNR